MQRHPSSRAIKASIAITSLLFTVGLSGCQKAQSSASLMADAQQYRQKGDNNAALIQLKNAASQSPQDAEVRFQLASLYNEMGNAISAEKEVRKAISLGGDSTRTAPALAKALVLQGHPQKAIDESASALAKASADLLATRGDAYLAINDLANAKASYEQALKAQPGLAEALIGLARLAMFEKDTDSAVRLTEQAIAANPKNSAVWLFKGNLMRTLTNTGAAIDAYGQAIAFKPDNVVARIERATVEIDTAKFDAAKTDIDAAKKISANAPIVLYTQALLDFAQGKFAAARESLQKVLTVFPEHMPTILLSGAVELNLAMPQQAEQHLRKYVKEFPNNVYARKLLAHALLMNSQASEAAAVLAPLLQSGANDAQLLALAGESSMQAKDFSKAAGYFEKASVLSPKNAALHTSLGLSKLKQGNSAEAISELQAAASIDPKSEISGRVLVQAELRLKHFDKAMAAVQAMEKSQPNSAEVQNLKGGVFLAMGDAANARASFEKALAIKPDFFGPLINLVQLDVREKKPALAKQRLERALKTDKTNIGAMLAMADISIAEGHAEQATPWLEMANNQNPDALASGLRLGAHYLATKQPQKALTLMRKLKTAHAADAEVLDLLGQAQQANNDQEGALQSYSTLVNVRPNSALAHMRLAAVHVSMKNEATAAEDLKRASAAQPDYLPARIAQIELAMRRGKSDDALRVARELQMLDPKSPVGYLFEADVQVALKHPALALPAYEKAFAITKSPNVLIKIAQSMKLVGKAKEAESRLLRWRQANPSDAIVPIYLSETYLAAHQFKQAAEVLRDALKILPDNPVLLNNLAWAYQQDKDPRALETAERAEKISPNTATILDTLGWTLVEQGQTGRAVQILQKASNLAPAAPDIRYHLAVALSNSGDKVNARKELNKLISDNKPFPQMDDAKARFKILE